MNTIYEVRRTQLKGQYIVYNTEDEEIQSSWSNLAAAEEVAKRLNGSIYVQEVTKEATAQS